MNDLERSQSPDEDFPWIFDTEQAAQYVQFIETVCVHSRGSWAGKPFILSPWRVFLLPSSLDGCTTKTETSADSRRGTSLLLVSRAPTCFGDFARYGYPGRRRRPAARLRSNNVTRPARCSTR